MSKRKKVFCVCPVLEMGILGCPYFVCGDITVALSAVKTMRASHPDMSFVCQPILYIPTEE